jgi:ribokinase
MARFLHFANLASILKGKLIMKTWDIVVLGGANTDYTIRGSQLPKPGETTVGESFHIDQGGKGANQAVAASRLGAQVALIACLGNDERGDAMLEQLRREKVDTEAILRDKNTATGAAVIQVASSGEKQIFAAPNANANLKPEDLGNTDILRNTQILLTQLEVPLETVFEASRIAAAAGAKVVLDPAPAKELPDDFFQYLSVIKPNSREAEQLTGIKVSDKNSARKAAESLLQRGVKLVAIQAGDEGNLIVWPEGEFWLPKIPVKAVDATGAGDAFAAAFAVALVEGFSWEEAGHFANTAAALTTTKIGAQASLPTRTEVDSFQKMPNHREG